MGLFDNILNKIAPAEETDFEETSYQPEQNAYIPRDPRIPDPTMTTQTTPVVPASRSLNGGTSMTGSAIEMKVVKPESFNAVGEIADLLLAGNTVLLNLEETNKETTRRLIDFMTGVAYAIHGELRRIANNTYVVTPNNVHVSDNEEADGSVGDSTTVY